MSQIKENTGYEHVHDLNNSSNKDHDQMQGELASGCFPLEGSVCRALLPWTLGADPACSLLEAGLLIILILFLLASQHLQ